MSIDLFKTAEDMMSVNPDSGDLSQHEDKQVTQKIKDALSDYLPITSSDKSTKLELLDVRVDRSKDVSQKPKAINDLRYKGKSYSVPIKAKMRLTHNGKTLDEKELTVANHHPIVPGLNTRLIDGNLYQSKFQVRRQPGVYPYRSEKGQDRVEFNTSKGRAFQFVVDGDKEDHSTMDFFVTKSRQTIPRGGYAMLRAFGQDDEEIKEKWGEDIWQQNAYKLDADGNPTEKMDEEDLVKTVDRVYNALKDKKQEKAKSSSMEEASKNLKKRLDEMEESFDPTVNERTIGVSSGSIDSNVIDKSLESLVKQHTGERKPPHRFSERFRTLHGMPDQIGMGLSHYSVKNNMKGDFERMVNEVAENDGKIQKGGKLKKPTIGDVASRAFGKARKKVESVFKNSDLSTTTETNNILDLESRSKEITIKGPGGIQSKHAVTPETISLHPSRLGLMDVVKTQVSAPGETMPMASGAIIDPDGQIKRMAYDRKLKKMRPVSTEEVDDDGIAFPDEFDRKEVEGELQFTPKKDKIKAAIGDEVLEVDEKEVRYVLSDETHMFSDNTNIIPFLNHDSGPRAIMGANQMTQALSLKDRESPLVDTIDEKGETFSHRIGDKYNAHAPVSGKVVAIDDNEINIEDESGNVRQVPLLKDFPLNQGGFIDQKPIVEVGDEISKGDTISSNNYTDDDGELAIGRNLRTAYLPFDGWNYEDAIVMSETGASKLTSEAMEEVSIELQDEDMRTPRDYNAHQGVRGNRLSLENEKKLGDDGVIKEGEEVEPGDILAVCIRPVSVKDEEEQKVRRVIGGSFKSLDKSLKWDGSSSGVVKKVEKSPTKISVFIRTEEPFKEGDKLCYTPDHEVLTDRGWVLFPDLKMTDKVCTLDPDTEKIQYDNPTQVTEFDHDGNVYRLETNQLDFKVTPGHHMFVNPRNPKVGGEEFAGHRLMKARDIFGKRVKYKTNGMWEGVSRETLTIPSLDEKHGRGNNNQFLQETYTDKEVSASALLYLFGIYIAEGSTTNGGGGNYSINIAQKRGRPGYAPTIEALTEMGFTPHEKDDRIVVHNKQLWRYIRNEVPGYASEKRIPRWILSLSKENLQSLFDGLVDGDGHQAGTKYVYTTTSKGLADDVHELALKLGMAGCLTYEEAKTETIKGTEYECSEKWRVYIRTKRLEPTVNYKKQNGQTEEWQEYQGKVYCCTVPTHVLYVRRNGKAAWCGNTGRHGEKGIVSCYDKNTEILTDRGWVEFSSLTEDDKVAQLENDQLKLVKPEKIHSYDYNGELLGYESERLNYLVTPNHRKLCRISNYRGKKAEYKIRTAEEAHNKTLYHKVGAKDTTVPNEVGEYFEVYRDPTTPGRKPPTKFKTEDFLEFMGWYLSEGFLSNYQGKGVGVENSIVNSYKVHIGQCKKSNPKHCEQIEDLLDRMGVGWSYSSTSTRYTFSNKPLYQYLKPLGLCDSKYLPRELFLSGGDALRKFINALMKGDGTRKNSRHSWALTTTSKQLAEDTSEVWGILGEQAVVRGPFSSNKTGELDQYRVTCYKDRHESVTTKKGFYKVKYDDKVYCVTVPSGVVYVRRNGVPMFSGNSIIPDDEMPQDKDGQPMDMLLDPHGVPCYDPETEILTYRGWVRMDEVEDSDAVATLNPDTFDFEWQEMEEYHRHDYEGKMYEIQNQQVDLKVTPNHNMWVQGKNCDSFSLEKAKTIQGKARQYLKTANWKESNLTQFIHVSSYEKEQSYNFYDHNWAEFIGWYIVKGSVSSLQDGVRSVNIWQSEEANPEDYNRIKELLNDMRIIFQEREGEGFVIYHKGLYEKLLSVNTIPRSVLDMGQENLRRCFDVIVESYAEDDYDFLTVSKKLADHLQEAAIKLGLSATIAKESGKYSISLSEEQASWVNEGEDQHEAMVDYSGKVYCPTVPNGIVMVRRGGKHVWSGNSRANPGQIMELAAGKIAKETGEKYQVKNFTPNMLEKVKKDLDDLGLSDKEDLYDPKTGRKIPNVATGYAYKAKLKHKIDKKFKARKFFDPEHGYDLDEQPVSGAAIDNLTLHALIGHNARANMSEMARLKGTNNTDYWQKLANGIDPPKVADSPFSFKKMQGMMESLGINIEKDDQSELKIIPATDEAIMKKSSGEMTEPGGYTVRANSIDAIESSVFDPNLVGRNKKNWNHIDIGEKVPNPLFDKAIALLLKRGAGTKEGTEEVRIIKDGDASNSETMKSGFNFSDVRNVYTGDAELMIGNEVFSGPDGLEKALDTVDVDKTIEQTEQELKDEFKKVEKGEKKTNPSKINNMHLSLRYAQSLKENEIDPKDGYMMSKVPVMPTEFRQPFVNQSTGEIMMPSVNNLYRSVIAESQNLKKMKEIGFDDEMLQESRQRMVGSFGALLGNSGDRPQGNFEGRGIVDTLSSPKTVSGTQQFDAQDGDAQGPKKSYPQDKVVKKKMEASGRTTIIPDPDLSVDEVGLPEEMAWRMYEPFVRKRMIKQTNLSPAQARKEYKDRTDRAMSYLEEELEERPVMTNRAPSWWSYNIMSFKPKLIKSDPENEITEKALRVPNLVVNTYFGGDYDGDSVSLDTHIVLRVKGRLWQGTLREFIKEMNGYVPDENAIFGVEGLETQNADGEWVPVSEVSVHRVDKPTYEVETYGGHKVKVTSDHSLMVDGKEVRPEDIQKGEDVLDNIEYSGPSPSPYKVKEVREVEQEPIMVDLSVPGDHVFTVDSGIVVHNTMSVHVPAEEEAVQEAKKMKPSNHLKAPGSYNLMINPNQSMLLGMNLMSKGQDIKNQKIKKKTNSPLHDYENGDINLDDAVEYKGKKETAGWAIVDQAIQKGSDNSMNLDKLIEEINEERSKSNKDLIDRSTFEIDKWSMREDILPTLIENHKEDYAPIMSQLSRAGNVASKFEGFTVGLSDMKTLKDEAQNLSAQADKMIPAVSKEIAKEKGLDGPTKATDEAARIRLYSSARDFNVKGQKVRSVSSRILDSIKSGDDDDNAFYKMMNVGSKGNERQIQQVLGSYGVVDDVQGNTVPNPIKNSLSDGLTTSEYFTQQHGAVAGLRDRSVETSKPGDIGKQIVAGSSRVVVSMKDCGTNKGEELPVLEKKGDDNRQNRNLIDRVLAEDVPEAGLKKGELVTGHKFSKIESTELEKVKVRSPLHCEADEGVCQKCFGYNERGKFPDIGENVGIREGQSIVEASTKLTLKSFHTGGATEDQQGGFEEFEEVVHLKNPMHKATIVKLDGPMSRKAKVMDIKERTGPTGRVSSRVIELKDQETGDTKSIRAPARRTVKVSVGDIVSNGEALTSGRRDPNELILLGKENEGVQEVQKDVTENLYNIFDEIGGINRRAAETVVSAMSGYGQVTDPGDSDYTTGDRVKMNKAKNFNKKLEQKVPIYEAKDCELLEDIQLSSKTISKGTYVSDQDIENVRLEKGPNFRVMVKKNPININQEMNSVLNLPRVGGDWLPKLNYRKIKKEITDAGIRGDSSDVRGSHPVGAYMYGKGMDDGTRKDKWNY